MRQKVASNVNNSQSIGSVDPKCLRVSYQPACSSKEWTASSSAKIATTVITLQQLKAQAHKAIQDSIESSSKSKQLPVALMREWRDELCNVPPKELTDDTFTAVPEVQDDVQPGKEEWF